MKYKKGSAWKRREWDPLSIYGKIWHVIKVIMALLTVILMVIVAAWFVITILGIGALIQDIRNIILLDIMHSIFG